MNYRTIKTPATLGNVNVKKVENTAYKIIKDKPILHQTYPCGRVSRKMATQRRKEQGIMVLLIIRTNLH